MSGPQSVNHGWWRHLATQLCNYPTKPYLTKRNCIPTCFPSLASSFHLSAKRHYATHRPATHVSRGQGRSYGPDGPDLIILTMPRDLVVVVFVWMGVLSSTASWNLLLGSCIITAGVDIGCTSTRRVRPFAHSVSSPCAAKMRHQKPYPRSRYKQLAGRSGMFVNSIGRTVTPTR